MRIAVFPGSFDPVTIGHQDIIAWNLARTRSLLIVYSMREMMLSVSNPVKMKTAAVAVNLARTLSLKIIRYCTDTVDS